MKTFIAIVASLLIAIMTVALDGRPSAASAIQTSRFAVAHPALMRELLTRPGSASEVIHGMILQQNTAVFRGPWLGVPENFPSNGKTVVVYTVSWRKGAASGRWQLYAILGPLNQVLQAQVTGVLPGH